MFGEIKIRRRELIEIGTEKSSKIQFLLFEGQNIIYYI